MPGYIGIKANFFYNFGPDFPCLSEGRRRGGELLSAFQSLAVNSGNPVLKDKNLGHILTLIQCHHHSPADCERLKEKKKEKRNNSK